MYVYAALEISNKAANYLKSSTVQKNENTQRNTM